MCETDDDEHPTIGINHLTVVPKGLEDAEDDDDEGDSEQEDEITLSGRGI